MERPDTDVAIGPPSAEPDVPALLGPDAAPVRERREADEAAAGRARDRYRTLGMEPLELDAHIAPLLAPDERVLAVRHDVIFDRRQSSVVSDEPIGMTGHLYVTARRIVFVGRVTISFDFHALVEVGLSGDQLLLVLSDGTGVSLDVTEPRLLRVQIGIARASARDQSASAISGRSVALSQARGRAERPPPAS